MRRSKAQIIARMNEVGKMNRFCGLGARQRSSSDGDISEIDIEKRLIPFILVSDKNSGDRMDWWSGEVYIEELDVNGARFDSLQTFFKDHHTSVDTAIGRVEDVRIDGNQIKADVFFGSDDDAQRIFQKYRDGILSDVSVGYRVNDIVITTRKNEPDHILVTDFEIVELSAVWRGFDSGATIGRSAISEGKLHNVDIKRKRLNLKQKEIR